MRFSVRSLLWAGVAVPFLYYGTVLASAATFPGYSHARQYASELGGPEAPFPALFNTGILLGGLAAIAAAVGIGSIAGRAAGRTVLARLAAVAVGAFGISLLFGGLFPMPDPRHNGFGLPLAILAAPPLLALALRGTPGTSRFNTFQWIDAGAMWALFAVLMQVGGLVTRSNVGLFQRGFSATIFPWIGIASFTLLRVHRTQRRIVGAAPEAKPSRGGDATYGLSEP